MAAVSNIFVSVVAPLHDDADIVEAFVDEVVRVTSETYSNYEIVLIDDGSTDRTRELIGALLESLKCIRYIQLSRRFGIEVAIAAGLDTAIGDCVVVLHPDMDPPVLIPEMVTRALRCGGVVFGVPVSRPGEPGWSALGRRLFHHLASGILGLRIPENASQFQALSRNAVNGITRIHDKNRHLRLLSLNVGYATETYPYQMIQRRRQRRSRGFGESVSLAIALAVSNSTRPLRALGVLGVAVSGVNLASVVFTSLVSSGDHGAASAISPFALSSSLSMFLLFLLLVVLGEYVGRILDESRDRPLYHVVAELNSNVVLVDPDRRNVVGESEIGT